VVPGRDRPLPPPGRLRHRHAGAGAARPGLADAYLEMGKEVWTSGRPAEALDWLQRAMDLAEQAGADDIRQRALQYRGCARDEIGDLGGLQDVRESVELGLRLGLGRGTALAYGNLGAELFELEGPAAGMLAMQAGLELCEQRGITEVAHWLSVSVVECLFDLGRWDEALGQADRLLARHQDLAESYEGVSLTARKAHILAGRGEVGEAVELQRRFLPRARAIGDPQVVSNAFAIAAFIEQAGGDLDAALGLVAELEQATRDGPSCYRADPLPIVSRICLAAGAPELAEPFLARRPATSTAGRPPGRSWPRPGVTWTPPPTATTRPARAGGASGSCSSRPRPSSALAAAPPALAARRPAPPSTRRPSSSASSAPPACSPRPAAGGSSRSASPRPVRPR
jgi:tetratricopeptide (TPR) repeat protein